MPIGSVQKFNQMESVLLSDANRQWDDTAVGSCMFILADNTYTPAAAHTTAAELSGVITAGDGAPINLATPTIDAATLIGTTFLDSDPANFGVSVSVTAKYLICVQPATAASFLNTTDKLLWYVDLDTTSSSASKTSTASDFSINTPVNGWVDFT